ncbi:MAG: 5-dehydro-2-deoxygluconokinase [Phototrophicaceae bacterium]
MMPPEFIAIGRASLDLFSDAVGVPFDQITRFAVYAGGTPLNVAVAAQRLGISAALLTGLSDDGVGRLIRRFLTQEGVNTDYATPKAATNTNAFMLAIQPPNTFEEVPYQINSADLSLSVADVQAAPIASARAILFTGMGLLSAVNFPATLQAAETAQAHGVTAYMDLDYKAHQWQTVAEYGLRARAALRLVDVAIGTEEEVCAAAGMDDPHAAALAVLRLVHQAVIVKRGGRGATLYLPGGAQINAPVFTVDVLNVFGAGDAFAAGVVAARLRGQDWSAALRQGAACGALIVTRHGCAADMPTHTEVAAFLAERSQTE